MPFVISSEPICLEMTSDGVLRVGGTRVTLDTVLAAFNEGATAEEIAQRYPSLELADIYSVIGYYLRRRQEVEQYLAERQLISAKVREQNQARWPNANLRERLLARRRERQ